MMKYTEIETRGEKRKRKAREWQAARRAKIRAEEKAEGAPAEKAEARKRKDRERQAARRVKIRAKKSEERAKKRQRICLEQRIRNHLARDYEAKETKLPLRVLEMNEDFQKIVKKYAAWPQPISKEVAKSTLAEFRDNVALDKLRELPCAVCSVLCTDGEWTCVPIQDIDISLLQVPTKLTAPSFEINFCYNHPDIDSKNYKVLLDRDGFIYRQEILSEQQAESGNFELTHLKKVPFDLRVCNTCLNNLNARKIPPLSLSNHMWIGSTPLCLQDLTIPEQLLISPGYLCMNLVQLSEKRHTHHKLKGHIVTLPQNPVSLTKVLPLPMYRLCEHLKVVFVGQGKPTDHQLKKVLQVRKSKIVAALLWLCAHNVLFNNINIDEEALNALPEGEIPEALAVTITAVNIDPRKVEHYTGYTHDPMDNGGEDDREDAESDNDSENGFDTFSKNTIGSAHELRTSGIVHVDHVPVSEREITLLSLQKIINQKNDQSREYLSPDNSKFFTMPADEQPLDSDHTQPEIILMPHGNIPLNEYTDANLFPAAFPVLYPYGIGGHEDHDRSKHISLKEYANHLMRHRDPKFRQHRSFSFVIFNILQRREVASSCYTLAKRANFERSAELIATLTLEDMKVAIDEEQNDKPVSNPAVLELLRNISSAGSKLMASHQSHARMRNEIRAIIVRDGTPSLFITINPADLHSPIVMMYAGKEVNLDTLPPDDFPTTTERARLAHLDPSAVAKYFHVVMKNILSTIVGYSRKEGGVFGDVKNYYGVVEYQDRGTPHCHMLIWLHGVPDPITLRQKLKDDADFRQRLLEYVSEIVKEDISYLLSEGEILTDQMLKDEYTRPKTQNERRRHPSFFPIPDPTSPDFDNLFHQDLLAIAKRTLFHKCSSTCKKYNRGSERNCRFDFPRELVASPGIVYPEQGIIAVQRANAFINNHNPYVTAACRGNNDIKFITARKFGLAYVHYLTKYITDSDVSTHSSFLMCAATLDTFLSQPSDTLSANHVDRSRRLVAKCLNRIASQNELTGPQVSAYLLGIPDHYTPSKFTSIHLQTFESYIEMEWARYQNRFNAPVQFEQTTAGGSEDNTTKSDKQSQEKESLYVTSFNNKLIATNLRIDYQFRGQELRGMCLYDYAASIQKTPITSQHRVHLLEQVSRCGDSQVDRFLFLGGDVQCTDTCDHQNIHPQHATHLQIHRRYGTERVVMLCGKGIPAKDDAENIERYGLCILMLFKPWETIYDLRENYSSWYEACQAYLNDPTCSPRLHSIIDNIELLHRCSEETTLERELREKARNDETLTKALRIERSVPGYDAEEEQMTSLDMQYDPLTIASADKNYGNFDPARIVKSGLKNHAKIDQALLPLRLRGLLPIDYEAIPSSPNSTMEIDEPEYVNEKQLLIENDDIRTACSRDDDRIKIWQSIITSRNAAGQNQTDDIDIPVPDAFIESQINTDQNLALNASIMLHISDPLYDIASTLNERQRKAFFLVCDHRRRNSPDRMDKPSQLLLYLSGSGGTGKSRVIQAIAEYFERVGQRSTLMILAPTGIAAANISGSTIHAACGLSFDDEVDNRKNDVLTGEALQRLQDRWAKIEYVIIDEISVLGQTLLARFHASLQKAKSVDNAVPFAGMNILFAGDFMQLPPVQEQALYTQNKVTRIATLPNDNTSLPSPSQHNSPDIPISEIKRKCNVDPSSIRNGTVLNAIGRHLWLSVKHVVQLTQQMRQIDDHFYARLLENMRNRCLTNNQRQALQSRIIGEDRMDPMEWKDAVFLVPRNEIRVQINFDSVRQHALSCQQPIVYSCATDTYFRKKLTGRRRQLFLSAPDTKNNRLCGILPLSIGMTVVITVNICTNDGIANGTRGILRQIVYDQDTVNHTCSLSGRSIVLDKPPKYVVVELIERTVGSYAELPPNHIPVYPIKKTCTLTIWNAHNVKIDEKHFQRHQLPLTPAYAFTDYKSQGKTLQKAIVDLTDGCTDMGAYVMLSRVRKLQDLQILRPFNMSILDMKIPPDLRAEFQRLDKYAQATNLLETWPDETTSM